MLKALKDIYDKYSIEDLEYEGTELESEINELESRDTDIQSEINVVWLSCSIDDFKENFNAGMTGIEKEKLLKEMQLYVKVLQ